MVKTSQNRNSVKIVLDFTGFFRLLGNNSVIPFLTAAEKRHFHPPKLPALRAEVVSPAQKSARVFSCFSAAAFKISRFCPFECSGRSGCFPLMFALCLPRSPKLPHGGATSGLRASGGYTPDCVLKVAQTADTGVTGWDWRFVCALNLCFQQNRHIFVLPHPRPVSASVGHSPAGVPPELVGW